MINTLLAEHSFLMWRTTEWEAIGVCVTAALTAFLVVFAVRQFGHARQVRDDQTRPYIIVDFSFRSILVEVSVKNIGQTAARNVRVKFDEELTSADPNVRDLAWQHEGLFGDGVAMFAPGREMRYLLDTFDKRHESDLLMSISGTVDYQRHDGRQVPTEPFTINLSPYALALMVPKDISDIADEAEKIRKAIELLAQRMATLASPAPMIPADAAKSLLDGLPLKTT